MIDELNLSDEHKKLLEAYTKRNLMEELSFSAYHPTGKTDKQSEGYYKWLCLSAYMKIKELEEPQGDLISRERLKDAFDNLCCQDCKKCRNFRKEDSFYKCDLIENAPTVEPEEVYMTAKDYNLYLEGYKQGRKDFGRPQGRWEEINERIGIGEDNIYTSFKCPFCGYTYLIKNNFCPNCGARMSEGEQLRCN